MAIQYYNIQKTGEKYSLDKTTGKAQKVSSIPSGGATITWVGRGLPSTLDKTLKKTTPVSTPKSTSKVTPSPTPTQIQQPTTDTGKRILTAEQRRLPFLYKNVTTNQTVIRDLFDYYLGTEPSPADLQGRLGKPSQEIETELRREVGRTGKSGTQFNTDAIQHDQNVRRFEFGEVSTIPTRSQKTIARAETLPSEEPITEKGFIDQMVDAITEATGGIGGAQALTDEELISIIQEKTGKTPQEIAETKLTPFFEEKGRVGAESFKRALSNLFEERIPAVIQEQRQRQETIRGARADLAGAGLSYSGLAREELGESAAGGLARGGIREFAGAGEGLISTRLGEREAASRRAFQRGAEGLGLRAEEVFGTEAARGALPTTPTGLGLGGESPFDFIGGIRGTLADTREFEIEKKRQAILDRESGTQSFLQAQRLSDI